MAIESINHALSFLGVRGPGTRDPLEPVAGRGATRRLAAQIRNHDSPRPDRTDDPAVVTSLSKDGLERAANLQAQLGATNDQPERSTENKLSEEDQAKIEELKHRDQEVRRHEQAHKAAAGKLAARAPSFSYVRGPDGNQYAVSGEVQIDVSPIAGDPEATIRKMRQVQSAARAPANPSSADLKVAATAAKNESAARAERRQTEKDEPTENTNRPEARRNESVLPKAFRPSQADPPGGLLDVVA